MSIPSALFKSARLKEQQFGTEFTSAIFHQDIILNLCVLHPASSKHATVRGRRYELRLAPFSHPHFLHKQPPQKWQPHAWCSIAWCQTQTHLVYLNSAIWLCFRHSCFFPPTLFTFVSHFNLLYHLFFCFFFVFFCLSFVLTWAFSNKLALLVNVTCNSMCKMGKAISRH